jgi:hypothetical protein
LSFFFGPGYCPSFQRLHLLISQDNDNEKKKAGKMDQSWNLTSKRSATVQNTYSGRKQNKKSQAAKTSKIHVQMHPGFCKNKKLDNNCCVIADQFASPTASGK